MQFLKTLFWVMLAVVAAIFGYRNWLPVTIGLWGGLEVDIKLPVLLLATALIGFLPIFLIHKTARWQWRRRLDALQRALDDERGKTIEGHPATLPEGPVALDEVAPHSTLL